MLYLSVVRCLVVAALLIFCWPDVALAQDEERPVGLPDLYETEREVDRPSLSDLPRRSVEAERLAALPTAQLEGPVDPAHYIVGPGDLFSVFIGGTNPISLQLPVTADGFLVLPDAGTLPVAGVTLAEVRQEAIVALETYYSNVRTEIALLQPRQFLVHVTGAVPSPGRYPATAVARVSSVVDLAFAEPGAAAVANPDFEPSLRHVRIERTNGESETVDLLRYYATGATSYNPFLRDGDVLRIGTYHPSRQSVLVDGAVAFPGRYAYRTSDTVRDLVALSTGSPDLDPGTSLRLTRAGTTRPLTAADFDTPLIPRDQLFIGGEIERTGSATAQGAVRFPGTYPIVPGETTLQQLIEAAGGFRNDALLRAARLIRNAPTQPVVVESDPLDEAVLPMRYGYTPLTDQEHAARPQDLYSTPQRLVRLSRLDFLGRDAAQRDLLTQNFVATDLTTILAEDAPPLYLADGDRLVIPRDNGTVFVFGEVNRPGYVAFAPGLEVSDYLRAAGGPARSSDDVFVVEARTGAYVPARDATVQSGDLVFVSSKSAVAATPELQRLAVQIDRERRERRLRTIQTAFTTISTLVTLYLAIDRAR